MVKTKMVDWSLTRPRAPLEVQRPRIKVNVKAFIQARMTSTRLPGKIYEDINGAPMLFHTINAAKCAKLINEVIVVSPAKLPELPVDIVEFIFDGPEEDVLGRYHAALEKHPCDYIVRLTSDCPFLVPDLIDFVIANSIGFDYGSNVLAPTFPDGMDIEVISAETMRHLHKYACSRHDREHVTTVLRNCPQTQIDFNMLSIQAFQDQSYIKLSVDTQEDLEKAREMGNNLCQK